jgi:hypothetical protein
MRLRNTTPDGNFTLTIRSVFDDPDKDVPDESLQQLVRLLEQTAQTVRLMVDPDLQRARATPVPAGSRCATDAEAKAASKRMIAKHGKALAILAKRSGE